MEETIDPQKLNDIHFHHKDKMCKLMPYTHKNTEKNKTYYIYGYKCITHRYVFTCRCGWEFGWHRGDKSCN